MSFKLVAQVMDMKVGSPLRKIILIKLADQASDAGLCWPSYESIAKTCEISKRSVITHIQILEKEGFLRIEKRYNHEAGKNFSNRYHLTLSRGGANAALVQMSVQGSEGAALGSEGAAPEPTNEPIKEPINKNTGAKKERSTKFKPVKPDEVSEQIWNDLLILRKETKASNSQTAWTAVFNGLAKAQKATGHSLDKIITFWIGKAWKGFNADWYLNAQPKPQQTNYQGNNHANHQSANNQPKQSSADIYAAKLAEQRRQREAANTTATGSDRANVYDMEETF